MIEWILSLVGDEDGMLHVTGDLSSSVDAGTGCLNDIHG